MRILNTNTSNYILMFTLSSIHAEKIVCYYMTINQEFKQDTDIIISLLKSRKEKKYQNVLSECYFISNVLIYLISDTIFLIFLMEWKIFKSELKIDLVFIGASENALEGKWSGKNQILEWECIGYSLKLESRQSVTSWKSW